MISIKILLLLSYFDTILSFQSPLVPTTTTCGEVFIKQNQTFNVFTSKTYHGEFPWHVAVYRREKYGSRTFICSGVLINQNTVVTTAHCLYGDYGVISWDSLIVSLGKYDIDISTLNTEELHVTGTIIYKRFDRFNLEHDIALIKMATMATYTNYVQPICLVNRRILEATNSSGILVGWGRNKFSAKENFLTKGRILLQMADVCRHNHMYLFENLLHASKMCGKYTNCTNLCSGDSGSGLFYEQNDRWYLRGIFSLGVSLPQRMECETSHIILFTDILNYYDWIVQNM